MIVCVCRAVSDRQIRSAVARGARTVADVRVELGCGSCCGKCAPRLRELVHQHADLAQRVVQEPASECACSA